MTQTELRVTTGPKLRLSSIAELEAAIDKWASHWNDDPKPFVWAKTVDDIAAKIKRGRATLHRITESATHH